MPSIRNSTAFRVFKRRADSLKGNALASDMHKPALKKFVYFLTVGISPLLAAGVLGGVAHAQNAPTPEASPLLKSTPSERPVITPAEGYVVGEDGLTQDGAYVEADEVVTESENVIVARGNVEVRHHGRIIRADMVRYDKTTGKTLAQGNAVMINPDGSTQYADTLEVNEDLTAGYGTNFASVQPDNTKIFAERVERRDEDTNVLNNALYTPCEICVKPGEPTKGPTWSFQAGEIIQDKKRNVVIYKNAIFKMRGVPLFYTPILWHADPSAKASSGLLMPKIGSSQRRGMSYEQPYLWVISPYQDLVISPQFNEKVAPLLNTTWRRRFYSGDVTVRAGYTREAFFDNDGNKWGEKADRSYILADGEFKINPDWRWSFTAERVSDSGSANFFERYQVGDVYEYRGVFTPGSRQLISQINLTRQTDTAFVSATMATFQNLRIAALQDIGTSSNRPVAGSNKRYPLVAPVIEAQWNPINEFAGGRFKFNASGVALFREDYVGDPIAPDDSDGTSGYDSARLTLGAEWRRDFVTNHGIKAAPFLSARHDQYRIDDLDSAGRSANVSRSLATAGLDLSYPMIRKFDGFDVVLTPIAQLAVSPKSKSSSLIPNEDSQVFEYDETTLFKANKSPGYDLYEGGARASLGLKAQVQLDSGTTLKTLVGRTFRNEVEDTYLLTATSPTGVKVSYDPSGLAKTSSDWVVTSDFKTGDGGYYGYSKLRLDSEDGGIRRGEVGFTVNRPNTVATVRYIVDNTAVQWDTTNTVVTGFEGSRYEDVQLYARHFFTKNWGASMRINRDLKTDSWRRSEISAIYRDDCTWVEVVYERDETAILGNTNGKASSGISLRLNLAILGSSGSDFNDIR
jgi:LPS-assembly protein